MKTLLTIICICIFSSCQIPKSTNSNDTLIPISSYRKKEVLDIVKIGKNDIVIFFTDGTELIIHSAKSITKNNSDGTKEKRNIQGKL